MTHKRMILAAVSFLSLAGAFVSTSSYAGGTQGMERRDDRRETRQDARQEKQDCKAGDESSRAECRQEKRDTKQDARGPGDDPDPEKPEAGDSSN
jgi:hypothetical protein